MWRDQLTPEERQQISQAAPGSLVHKLVALLDQREQMSDGRIPGRSSLSRFDRDELYIPQDIIRLDE